MVALRESTHIRIIRVPPGEAPEMIRAQWVGLVLPLAHGSSAFQLESVGVLSGKKEDEPVIGYLVEVKAAVEILAMKSVDAASWWRTNASHLFADGMTFIFHEHVCELL
jgi:hypothetical protein